MLLMEDGKLLGCVAFAVLTILAAQLN